MIPLSTRTALLPFQPASMSTAQLAAVSFLARYSGRSHHLYSFQLSEWFAWCERNGLDPLVGVQRAHVELYIRSLGERGLMDSVRGVDDERGSWVLPVRAHRRPHPGRPGRVRAAAEGPARRVPHPRAGPARADPVPAGRPDHHRPPRRTGVPARHQRPARLRGGGGTDRGLRRHAAGASRPPPGGQRQQARHHADHRPRAARPGGLPWRTDRGAVSSCAP